MHEVLARISATVSEMNAQKIVAREEIYSLNQEYARLREDLTAEAEVSEYLSRKSFDLRAEHDKLKEEVAGLAKLREECDRLRADLAAKTEVADTFERQASKCDEMYSQQFTEWNRCRVHDFRGSLAWLSAAAPAPRKR